MAKKLFLSLLFSTFLLDYAPILANIDSFQSKKDTFLNEQCDVPAPDSFRFTDAGTNFIDLAWHPSWNDATHTLIVQKENISGGWTTQNSYYNIPGSSYTVSNLEYRSKYRFIIATNCVTNNTPSTKVAYFDHIAFILDLTIQGRTPTNPTVVPGSCPAISYQAYNWVGFKVETINGFAPTSTFYEFSPGVDINSGSLYPIIKRVNPSGPIFAVGATPVGSTTFPKVPSPKIIRILGSTSFLIRHYLSETDWIIVGNVRVNLVESNNGNTVQICIDDPNWNQAYNLVPLTAQIANGFAALSTGEGSKSQFFSEFTAQNPFASTLNLFVPKYFLAEERILIRLLTSTGQLILEQSPEISDGSIAIPTTLVTPGFYILQIETTYGTKTIKVVKAE